jgi:DNA-binding transcriptional ArsR family regulator
MPKTAGFCAVFFSALANRTRVKMLEELCKGPMTVNQLTDRVKSERTLVSHNLALLSRADLVRFSKVGNTRVYAVNEMVVPYVFFLMDKIVCSRCSLRKTCAALRERGIADMQPALKPQCESCRD